MDILPATRLRPHAHVAGKIIDGELVAINLRTGLYYSSTGIGPVIWRLMEAGHTREQIAGTISGHFSVPHERVQTDVETFLARLVEEDLVAAIDGAAETGDAVVDYSGSYEAPSLLSFNDMEQAFALDPPLRA